MGGKKLRAEQHGVFPGRPGFEDRYSERNRVISRMLAQRAGLPKPERRPFGNLGNRELNVYAKKSEILDTIRDNQIVAIEGETGSGKSTQLGQYALEAGYKKVIHLVPRILIANNLGDQIQRELGDQVGEDGAELVGVHHSERHENPDAPIQVMTPGTFMRMKDMLDEYATEPVLIIGDEIHEKDFETEMGVGVSAMNLAPHPKWRLALVSATMDSKTVDGAYGPLVKGEIPHVHIEGRPHELTWEKEPELDPVGVYLKYGGQHERAIIFVAGKQEIRETIEALDKACASRNVRILPLHAKLPRADILKATHAALKAGERLVIVATSAAQSGITIPGLTLSIMDGTIRRPNLDEDGTEGLFKEYAAQDEIIQEGGRAGRDVGGGLAVLAKSADPRFGYMPLEERDPQAPAQVYSTNISRNALLATSLGVSFFDVNEFLIHKVDRRRILDAYEVLWRLQAIDAQNEITDTGETMNQFPLRPEFGRVLVAAMEREIPDNQLRQLIAIVCSVEAGGMPLYDKTAPQLWKKDVQSHSKNDYIASLDMFRATRKFYHTVHDTDVDVMTDEADGRTSRTYPGNYSFVNEAALAARGYDPKNVYRAHHTYEKICDRLGIEADGTKIPVPTEDDMALIEDLLVAGLFDYTHIKGRDEPQRGGETISWYQEVTRDNDRERRISDRSVMPKSGPEYVVGLPRRYERIVKGNHEVHNIVEQVMPTTIELLGKHVAHLTTRIPDRGARLRDGQLMLTDGIFFGSIRMGTESTQAQLVHTPETKAVLEKGIYDKPTQTISELIAIKRRLEYLQRRTQDALHATIFPHGVLTDEWLRKKIDDAITGETDSIYALDNNLRAMVVRDDISVRTWISEAHERLLRDNSPDDVELAPGVTYPLHWSHGRPIVNNFNILDVDLLPDDGIYLDDQRAVLFNFKNDNGDTKRMSAGELKRLLELRKAGTI